MANAPQPTLQPNEIAQVLSGEKRFAGEACGMVMTYFTLKSSQKLSFGCCSFAKLLGQV
ncbi:MAG: hypothetical protein IJS50_01610 [Desulfovibrio sp.]|nr:hypothetical protein [Desulfovibrio sp.]